MPRHGSPRNLSHLKIKPVPTATTLSESIKWFLSGSTLIHIIALLGLSFYIGNPVFQQRNPVIKVKLNSDSQLGNSASADHALQSFNDSMEATTQHSETENLANAIENPTATTNIIQSQSSQLNNFVEALERLRKQQAKLVQELHQGQQNMGSEAREVFTTSYSNDSEFDAYKESWRQHVEAYGNLNYPQKISDSALNGSLILDAVIRSDASLLRVDIIQSSGNPLIDQAAIDIVHAAAPYPTLPSETDNNLLMHIIRTWQFKHSNVSSVSY